MPLALPRAAMRQSQSLLRRTNLRHASSATEAASNAAAKAQETGSSAVSKASQGLSRVTSSAGPAITGAARGAGNALKKIGGRTGRFIGFVECELLKYWHVWFCPGTIAWDPGVYTISIKTSEVLHIAQRGVASMTVTNDESTALIPPTIYYSRVGLELAKLVFKGQKMSPP